LQDNKDKYESEDEFNFITIENEEEFEKRTYEKIFSNVFFEYKNINTY